MDNIFTILEAWSIAKKPSKRQKELAAERAKICHTCPSKLTLVENLDLGIICGECACPIVKKIFTNVNNPCPLKKWNIIDEAYFNTFKKETSLL